MSDPITFFNRYTGELEEEQIYGEGFLRWIYETRAGQVSLEAAVKRRAFSAWYGWRMDRDASREKVVPFILEFGLDPREFADAPGSFATFNEFFYRKLKPEARPIAEGDDVVVFPADGRHLAIPNLATGDQFFVKGQSFDLAAFVGSEAVAEEFAGGTLVLSRLCPVDYHRYHFPVGGKPGAPELLGEDLYSVSPIALRQKLSYLWENRRAVTRIETPRGPVLSIEIGATCVGGMEFTFEAGEAVQKGDEKGYFKFGGSSTVTVFQKGAVELAEDVLAHSAECRELYAKVGDVMGRWA